jgi:predicted nucleic-acid-binding protein
MYRTTTHSVPALSSGNKAVLNTLLADDKFCFEDRHRVATALDLYQTGKGDLGDYLIGLRGETKGARTTFTFARNLRNDPQFTVVQT